LNPRIVSRVLAAVPLFLLGAFAAAQNISPAAPPPARPASAGKLAAAYGKLPLSFEPNRGQTAKEVEWLARGPEYTLFLAGHDAVLEMSAISAARKPGELPKVDASALRMNLLGANRVESASGEEPLPGKANYFTGKDASKWQRDLPTFGKVRLSKVYPGIDLVYYGRRGQLEYDFQVAPGADASTIRMSFDGAQAKLGANGDLVLRVNGAGTEVRFDKPVVYQVKDGVRQLVEGRFTLAANHQVSFALGAYDRSRELIIDPVLLFLGTLGTGSEQTVPFGMAVNADGEIFLTGVTQDLKFPTTTGVLEKSCSNLSTEAKADGYVRCGPTSRSGTSGFVTKIAANGESLVYSTYLHGLSGQEYGASIALDSEGDAYILGGTSSTDFPVTDDAYEKYCQPTFLTIGCCTLSTTETSICDGPLAADEGVGWVTNGPVLFIAKLNPTGSKILYATFLGGTAAVYPIALALDNSKNIYVTGFVVQVFAEGNYNTGPAGAPNNGNVQFPVTSNAFETGGVGIQAATLSKLSANGHSLLYSTFMGTQGTHGFGNDTEANALAVGPDGIAYIGGYTLAADLPTTPGSIRTHCVENSVTPANCEAYAGFVSAFDTTKSGEGSLKYSTYIGGKEVPSGNTIVDEVNGLTVDSDNNLYVTGYTQNIDFPTTKGVYQPKCNHANNGNNCSTAFLSKINPEGTKFLWSTFFGGTNPNPAQATGNAVALDPQGNVYLYGMSGDGGGDLPTVNAVQGYFSGNKLFIAKFSSNASKLLFATRFGNTSTTSTSAEMPINANGVAVDEHGNVYFAGYTTASEPFVTTPHTYTDIGTGNGNRGFFAKIQTEFLQSKTVATVSPADANEGVKVTLTATVTGPVDYAVPAGTVTFASGKTVLGTGTLNEKGEAKVVLSSVPAGKYRVIASYSGDGAYEKSASVAEALTINPPAATPKFSLASGTYDSAQKVTITDTTPNATIYYALHGAIPTVSSTKYTGAITVSSSEIIKAVAIEKGYSRSVVAVANYTIK
jgi:hypothetical protein